jgi:hypothetical protein
MRIIVGGETSQKIASRFRARGHDAYSCDLLPTKGDPRFHIQGDMVDVIKRGWDMAIVHPTCTFLCGSGLHWNHRVPGRGRKTVEALLFVLDLIDLLNQHVKMWCLENPIGCLSTIIGKPSQILQPYNFGDDASKATCIWVEGLPELTHTHGMYRHALLTAKRGGATRQIAGKINCRLRKIVGNYGAKLTTVSPTLWPINGNGRA